MANLPARSTMTNTAIWNLFGAPPLLKGEDRAAFQSLLANFADDLKPADTIEYAWVWDITVLTWEINRYRSGILGLYRINTVRGLKIVLVPLYGEERLPKLLDHWAERDPEAIELVDELLQKAELTMEDVKAQTLSVKINDIERIEGLIMRAEGRRNSLYREIDRRRSTPGAVRKSVDDIQEAEFSEIGAADKKGVSAA